MSSIRKMVERSSLGTKQARAARRSIPNADAARVVSRAAAIARAPTTGSSRSPRPPWGKSESR
jgi:hypothetical protein